MKKWKQLSGKGKAWRILWTGSIGLFSWVIFMGMIIDALKLNG